MQVEHAINVVYKATRDAEEAKILLSELPDVFAADFETAVKYPAEQIEEAKMIMEDESQPKIERVKSRAIAKATALGHPSHCTITHCSIAPNEREAIVLVIDNQEIADVVLDFLTETKKKQIWHNYCYDGRLLRYYQGKDAYDVEDTQIFAKTLINHVETYKAKTSLKDLAGSWYGDWGISADSFVLDQQHEEYVAKYAAIDACATFKLWEYLNDFVRDHRESFQSK